MNAIRQCLSFCLESRSTCLTNPNYRRASLKGMVPQYFFYRSNFIFGIVEVPLCHSRYHVRRHSRSLPGTLGTKYGTKVVKFRGFIDPSDQRELNHTTILSQIFDRYNKKEFMGLSL